VTEHPIIMTAESVRAIRAGTKTQSRRVLKPQPAHAEGIEMIPRESLRTTEPPLQRGLFEVQQ
jgi:hypothetical protein